MCDGVGTHLTYPVVKRVVVLGLEIVLRVPHLSWVLQGEDTVNFKVFFIAMFYVDMYLLKLSLLLLLLLLMMLMMLLSCCCNYY